MREKIEMLEQDAIAAEGNRTPREGISSNASVGVKLEQRVEHDDNLPEMAAVSEFVTPPGEPDLVEIEPTAAAKSSRVKEPTRPRLRGRLGKARRIALGLVVGIIVILSINSFVSYRAERRVSVPTKAAAIEQTLQTLESRALSENHLRTPPDLQKMVQNSAVVVAPVQRQDLNSYVDQAMVQLTGEKNQGILAPPPLPIPSMPSTDINLGAAPAQKSRPPIGQSIPGSDVNEQAGSDPLSGVSLPIELAISTKIPILVGITTGERGLAARLKGADDGQSEERQIGKGEIFYGWTIIDIHRSYVALLSQKGESVLLRITEQ